MDQFTDDSRLGISGRVLAECVNSGRGALVSYLPVGFPDVPRSIEAMRTVCEAGTDLVEIGIPYSDPILDGTTIQRAGVTALKNGVRTADAFRAVEAVAAVGKTPMIMSYWNLIERYGVERFAADLAGAGGAGVITPDLTPDVADEWIAATDEHGLDRVFLIAPSSTDERIQMTMQACRGWVYATSVMGVTGARAQTSEAAPIITRRARQADPGLPVGIGLGISSGDQAAETVSYADAAIVGSALVKRMEDLTSLGELVSELADGVRRGRRR